MKTRNGKPRVELLDRQPPFDLQAEVGVLGSLFLMPEAMPDVAHLVKAADFYDEGHQKLFARFEAIRSAGKPLDPTIVADALKEAGEYELIGSSAGLSRIINAVPNAAHANYYAEIVAAKALKRRVIVECTTILRDAYDDEVEAHELVAAASAALAQVAAGLPSGGKAAPISDAADRVVSALENLDAYASVNRAMFGIRSVDEALGPMMPGEFCLLAARPGVGKTALAQQVLWHSVKRARPALAINLEMTAEELATRDLCRVSEIDSRAVRDGNLDAADVQALRLAQRGMLGEPFYVWSPAKASLTAIRSVVLQAVARQGVRLAVIDYLTLIDGDTKREERRDQLVAISRGLKQLAKEAGIPLLVVAQLNREGEGKNVEPTLRNIGECGAFERDTDMVLFLHQEDPKDQSRRTLIAAKFRHAQRGRIVLRWHGKKTQFSDLEAADHGNYDPQLAAYNRGQEQF